MFQCLIEKKEYTMATQWLQKASETPDALSVCFNIIISYQIFIFIFSKMFGFSSPNFGFRIIITLEFSLSYFFSKLKLHVRIEQKVVCLMISRMALIPIGFLNASSWWSPPLAIFFLFSPSCSWSLQTVRCFCTCICFSCCPYIEVHWVHWQAGKYV